MSKIPALRPAQMTTEQRARVEDITAAGEFLERFYPELSGRISAEDIIHLLTIGHMLFKTNPEYLEATTQRQRLPKQ